MNRRERQWVLAAVLMSVLVHVAVAVPVWDLSLGLGGRTNLFATMHDRDEMPVRVERSTRDEIVSKDEHGDELAVERSRHSQKVDVRKMVTPEIAGNAKPPAQESLGIAKPQAAGDVPEVAARGPSDVNVLVNDLSQVEAGVTLPRFVAVSDAAQVAGPSNAPIHAGERVKVGVNRGGGGRGEGTGAGGATDVLASGSGGGVGTGGGLGMLATPLPMRVNFPSEKQLPLPQQVDEHLDEDFDYVLTRYDGPTRIAWTGFFKNERTPMGHFQGFELEIRPRLSLKRLKAMGKDVVYVIDTSGSIGDKWLAGVKAGAASAMDALNDGDRFNVVMFSDKVRVFNTEGMVDANDAQIAAARKFISDSASVGYTDVNQALSKLVKRNMPADRVYQVIFISDGQPTVGAINPRLIIDAFTRDNNATAAIYAVAVGKDVNQDLLGALAYRNKGYVVSGVGPDKCADVMRDLASRLRYPILKDAVFSEAGVNPDDIYPQQPRDVYQGDPVVLFGRYTSDDQKLSMRMVGSNGSKLMDFSFTRTIGAAKIGDKDIATQWAQRKLHHLTALLLRQSTTNNAAIEQQIAGLKTEFDLK